MTWRLVWTVVSVSEEETAALFAAVSYVSVCVSGGWCTGGTSNSFCPFSSLYESRGWLFLVRMSKYLFDFTRKKARKMRRKCKQEAGLCLRICFIVFQRRRCLVCSNNTRHLTHVVKDTIDLLIAFSLFIFLSGHKGCRNSTSCRGARGAFKNPRFSLHRITHFHNMIDSQMGVWGELMGDEVKWCRECGRLFVTHVPLLSQLIVYNLSLQGSQLILNGNNSLYSSRRAAFSGQK